ncbi:DUF6531 domain-containing protein [Erwinia sorbitola]|uniref:DUF6531 domain-containing protein n=1 Tax=Erwinia sorbitola TaxID=2681984 RepID=UPI0035AB7CCC
MIAEGAETVFANGMPVARLGHRTSCDARINSGSGNIAETQQTGALVAEIKDSRNIFLRATSAVINTVLVYMGLRSSVSGIRNSFKQLSSAGEPVDVVTGDFLQQWPVIDLPGVLPLTLYRTYRSTGAVIIEGALGVKWANSWSQYLDIRPESIDYLDEEGCILSYHTPGNEVCAVNLRQPHYILSGDREGELLLFDRQTQRRYIFGHADGSRRYLSRIEDGKGNRITFSFRDNELSVIEHSAGYSLNIEVQDRRIVRVTLVTQEFSQVLLTCEYNHRGQLADCHSFQFGRLYHEYNDKGFMVHWRDTDQTQAWIDYDDTGRVVATRTAQGHYNDRFIYDDLNRHNIYIDAEGGETHYYYNEADLVTRAVDPLNGVVLSEWDLTRLTRTTDETGRVTSYQYNALGELLEVTPPGDLPLRYRYDSRGQITGVIRGESEAWRWQYDDKGMLRRTVCPSGLAIDWRYDACGNIVTEQHSSGLEWRYRYDAYGQLSAITAPGNITTRCHVDVLGRLWFTDAHGQKTRYSHSAAHARPGQSVTGVTYPDGSRQQIRYDSEGRIRKQTDGEGRESICQYGAFDLLLSRQRPDGKTVSYHYDRLTRLTGLTNAGGESYYLIRDAKGQVVEEQDFTGRRQRYAYDAAGRLVRKRCGRQTVTYRYTPGDRLAQELYWLEEENVSTLQEQVDFTYDREGRLTTAVNGSATVEFNYDERGGLTGERINGRAVTYQRDAKTGRVINQSLDTLRLSLHYDAASGRLEKTQLNHHHPLSFEYDPLGRESVRRSAGGFVLAHNYTANGLLFSQAAGRDSTLFNCQPGLAHPQAALAGSAVNRRYEYDRAHNVTRISDGKWGDMRYRHDVNDQVTEAELQGIHRESARFDYDANLNLTLGRTRRAAFAAEGEIVRMQRQEKGRQRVGAVPLPV